MKLFLLAAGGMILAAPGCAAQAALGPTAAPSSLTAPPYVPTLTFDVASVRQTNAADLQAGVTMSGRFATNTTNLRLVNWRIESILSMAYGVQEWQVAGVPKWPYPTVFVIDAKGDAAADGKMAALTSDQQAIEQRHMLQTLLAERFSLKTHWETREGDIYNLVVAKGGSKLAAAGSMPPTADEARIFAGRTLPPIGQKNNGRGLDFVGHTCPIDSLVAMLTSQFGRPVINHTGLTDKYDFVVTYRGRWDRDRSADDMDPTLPLDQALEKQLGLKLEPAKGQVKTLVVDHIEKPSEN